MIPPEDQRMIVVAACLVALVSIGLMECKHVNDVKRKEKDKQESKEFVQKLSDMELKANTKLLKPTSNTIFLTLSGLCIVHFNEKEFIHIPDAEWMKLTNHYETNILSTNVTINFYD